MKRILYIIPLLILPYLLNAQIISQFTWENNPVTNADIGPNASSVSTSATSSTGGADGTNGLNAGLPKRDINLVISDSSIFNVDGIEVSFDFQRDESAGTFFRRGNSLVINGTANLSVNYRVDDGAGGFNTVSSGNVYAIPNDNTFRNYVFYYLPTSGVGALVVDGTTVWSNDGPDNRPMYWAGAGDLQVGFGLDGSGSDRAFLDNLIIGEVSLAPLPIELIYFNAKPLTQTVELSWQTASEINNDYFTVERSVDGKNWEALLNIDGAGNSTEVLNYVTFDDNPHKGISYYQLKQTDFNGGFSYSDIEAVNMNYETQDETSIYPNPLVANLLSVDLRLREKSTIRIYNIEGQLVHSKYYDSAEIHEIKFNEFPGIYFVHIIDNQGSTTQFKLVKQ